MLNRSIRLKSAGIMAAISGQPSDRKPIYRGIQRVITFSVVLLMACLATFVIAGLTRGFLDTTEVDRAIRNSLDLTAPSDAELAAFHQRRLEEIEQELGETPAFAVFRSAAFDGITEGIYVVAGLGDEPGSPTTADPCDPDLTAPLPNAVCLFRTRPILPDELSVWSPFGAISVPLPTRFVQIEFPGTSYTLPYLAISAAERADEDRRFTQAASDRVRRQIEEVMGSDLFLPSDTSVLWARRLNGPIQYITYFLTTVAIISIGLSWLSSVAQNRLIRGVETVPMPKAGPSGPVHRDFVPLEEAANDQEQEGAEVGVVEVPSNDHREDEEETPPLLPSSQNDSPQVNPIPTSATANDDSVVYGAPPENTASVEGEQANSTPTAQQGHASSEVIELTEVPTPWNAEFFDDLPFDLTDAQRAADYFDHVSRQIQDDSRIFGVAVDPPALRFRRAAARAIANTQDTSILPSFLDAQKASIQTFYDARLSLVRFLIWAIPTVGFIGTILGVSAALSSTIGLQSAQEIVAAFSQSAVSAAMGMAFDTTLVALGAAIAVMLAFHLLQGAEDRMIVLERNRAEEEILLLSKAIRKPGSVPDLAQQLISLGIYAEDLVRNLGFFNTKAPEFQRLLEALRARRDEIDALNLAALDRGSRRSASLIWWLLFFAIAIILACYLSIQGVLGPDVQSSVQGMVSMLLFWDPGANPPVVGTE